MLVPAGGRWLWRTPPWLCSPGAAVGEWSWSSVVVVVVVVLVRDRAVADRGRRQAVGRRCVLVAWSWGCSCASPAGVSRGVCPLGDPEAPATPCLAEQHPATDRDDRDRRHDRRRLDHEIGRQDPLRPDDEAGQHEDPDACATARPTGRVRPRGAASRASRPGRRPSASCHARGSGRGRRRGRRRSGSRRAGRAERCRPCGRSTAGRRWSRHPARSRRPRRPGLPERPAVATGPPVTAAAGGGASVAVARDGARAAGRHRGCRAVRGSVHPG